MRQRLLGLCVAAGTIASAAIASAQTIRRPEQVMIVLMENTASKSAASTRHPSYVDAATAAASSLALYWTRANVQRDSP
jgi:hypothetical protein